MSICSLLKLFPHLLRHEQHQEKIFFSVWMERVLRSTRGRAAYLAIVQNEYRPIAYHGKMRVEDVHTLERYRLDKARTLCPGSSLGRRWTREIAPWKLLLGAALLVAFLFYILSDQRARYVSGKKKPFLLGKTR